MNFSVTTTLLSVYAVSAVLCLLHLLFAFRNWSVAYRRNAPLTALTRVHWAYVMERFTSVRPYRPASNGLAVQAIIFALFPAMNTVLVICTVLMLVFFEMPLMVTRLIFGSLEEYKNWRDSPVKINR